MAIVRLINGLNLVFILFVGSLMALLVNNGSWLVAQVGPAGAPGLPPGGVGGLLLLLLTTATTSTTTIIITITIIAKTIPIPQVL